MEVKVKTLKADHIPHPGANNITQHIVLTFADDIIPDHIIEKWHKADNKSAYHLYCVLDNFVPNWKENLISKQIVEVETK